MKTQNSEKYVVVTWPEIQFYMNREGFNENAYLINDEKGMEEFGSSAYFVNEQWAQKIEKELKGWDFQYEEEFPDTAGTNQMGVLTNGEYYLFFHVFAEEEGKLERCHIYSSLNMTGDNEECSYPWTSENDSLLLECLNSLKDKTDFCGEGSPIRSIKFNE